MKKILTAIAITILTLRAANAAVVLTPVGTVTVKLEAIVEVMPLQQVGGKTNSSATSTNITQMFKETITQTAFGNAELLALIANSFNTNFPAGSQVGMRFGSLLVVDSTGTNIVFNPNAVVSFNFQQDVVPETETLVRTENASGTQVSGNRSETFIANVTMNYDDTANTTTDGQNTKFSFSGLYQMQINENLKTHGIKTSLTFQGTGGGSVRGVTTILTGTLSSKGSGTLPSA